MTSILHLDTERGWRGGERQAFWLARALATRGHRSIVAARPGEPLSTRSAAAGLETVDCAPASELDAFAAWRLRRVILEQRVDVVHAHTGHAVATAALATLGTRVPMVLTRRVDFRLSGNAASRWKYDRAAVIIAISSAVRAALVASGIGEHRIVDVPSGIDLTRRIDPASPETLAALGIPLGAPLVVQVAQLVPHKDPLNFVRAIGVVRERVPNVRALLVGDGPLSGAVASAIAELGLAGTLVATGYRGDADALLAAATVVTLSSREEGLGTVLLDAFSLGKPVAAAAGGGIPDVVEHDVSGLLAPPGDSRALGSAIASLLTDSDLAGRLGRAARARAEDFSIDRTADRTLAVYERVLAERGGGQGFGRAAPGPRAAVQSSGGA